MAMGTRFEAQEIGFMAPAMSPVDALTAGEVGYVITGLKDVSELRVGDTLTTETGGATEPLPGYKDVKPMVFAGLFPTDSDQYPELRDALERLKLNDAALFYEPETSQALGFGFRSGFLGLLHMEIVRERLEREFDLDLLVTAPNVAYRVLERNGEWREVHSPADMPDEFDDVEEPYVKASIIVPKEYVGQVMELNNDRRGKFDHMEYLSPERVHLTYELPLGEIVLDYYDQLKSRTRGYASFDYDYIGFRPGTLVRVDVLVAGEPVDALSLIIHREFAYDRGRALVEQLKKEIPRQMFDVAIQAAIGARVIARETVKARRKDVLAKCYGGDITRKRKLLENQKKGKKRMKQVGAVEVPAGGIPRRPQHRGRQEVSGVRHLYVHLPFCAHRCGYCDFVTVVGRHGEHDAYVDALLRELELEAGLLDAAARHDLPRGRNADVHRAGRAGAPARRAARRARGDGRGQSRDRHARAGRASVTKPCQSCVARRTNVQHRASGRARTPRERGRRQARRLRSSQCRFRQHQPRSRLRDSGAEHRRPRARSRDRSCVSSPSISPATSWRRSREPASRTRTGRSSNARPRRWRTTSSESSSS